jgi:hypothetical protein
MAGADRPIPALQYPWNPKILLHQTIYFHLFFAHHFSFSSVSFIVGIVLSSVFEKQQSGP